VGVPRRDQVVDEEAQVRAEHVLPLLQPVLQRYAVEAKQTLRFAVGEAGLVRSTLLLAGPGAAIPSLATVLSSQIEIPVTAEDAPPAGPLELGARASRAGLALRSRAERDRRERAGLRRAMAAGGVLAVALIAADAARTLQEQYLVRRSVAALAGRAVDARHDIDLRTRAAALARRVQAQEQAAAGALGQRPDWLAFLDELGEITAGSIRLTDVQCTAGAGGYTASVRGVADLRDRSEGGPDPLAAYIERLQRSPMVEGVELGSTRLGEYEGTPVKHFAITAKLVGLPARLAGAEDRP
jgi:Tfp pilus assembly protein PilN